MDGNVSLPFIDMTASFTMKKLEGQCEAEDTFDLQEYDFHIPVDESGI